MIRISGVNLPMQKHICIALTAIYGIGRARALKVCEQSAIAPDIKAKDLSESQLETLRKTLANYRVEGDLKREVTLNIKRLVDSGCYRGVRHKRGLPVRGQRTRSNARTRKGRRKPMGMKVKTSK